MNKSSKKVIIAIIFAMVLLSIYMIVQAFNKQEPEMEPVKTNQEHSQVVTNAGIQSQVIATPTMTNVPSATHTPKIDEKVEPTATPTGKSAKVTKKPSSKPAVKPKKTAKPTKYPATLPTSTPVTKKTCTVIINCSTVLNHMNLLDAEKHELIPSDGFFLSIANVEVLPSDTVRSVCIRVCKEKGIPFDSDNSGYVRGINNLYEFDCGSKSGWKYRVNGEFPLASCKYYQVKHQDVIEFLYTCDMGKDLR